MSILLNKIHNLFYPTYSLFFEIIHDLKNKPLIYLTEILKIIWITPLMDRLWIGGSSERRRFLDRLVMNFFPNHAKNCILYEHALKKRNFLLK